MLLDQEQMTLGRKPGWEAGTRQALAICTQPFSSPKPYQVVPSLFVGCPRAEASCWMQPGRVSACLLSMPSALTLFLFQLAPENTLMSLHKAVDCDVQVFETDVMVR